MDAMISGRTGIAVILEGKALKSFDVDAPGVLVPRQETEMHFIFGDAQDIQIIENTNLDTVQQKLLLEYNCTCALDLALISLDAELPDEIRREAVEGLEELLSDAIVLEKLGSVLYGKPLPSAADIFGALTYCEQAAATRVKETFTRLFNRQALIQDVFFAWEAIPVSLFRDYQYQSEFHKTIIQTGILRKLVVALDGKENIDTFLLIALSHSDIKAIKNHKDVLHAWINPFKQPKDVTHTSVQLTPVILGLSESIEVSGLSTPVSPLFSSVSRMFIVMFNRALLHAAKIAQKRMNAEELADVVSDTFISFLTGKRTWEISDSDLLSEVAIMASLQKSLFMAIQNNIYHYLKRREKEVELDEVPYSTQSSPNQPNTNTSSFFEDSVNANIRRQKLRELFSERNDDKAMLKIISLLLDNPETKMAEMSEETHYGGKKIKRFVLKCEEKSKGVYVLQASII